ncbi:methionine ABC transporter ATP-binding protein [Vagococcus zengguangii]|uniref:Methionine ABC transporter ATP-binding protein n=1 Tax=Vagococcus zengguangii TaxID=2571750 RepID=A0A4D7CTP4_9ENTE|nr:methionine ABC transporter ATP-binding protein [Vagococcus zengguangii]QCI86504.1 methionine ABC transporter ATP-binding protein [Vagococcus zengguangii]TLG81246.1 methionine ABC transporter ATP-binding protein [Vagococcus zengguangii]
MIELKDISVTFSGKKEVQAVKDVNLSIAKGDVFGIVGYSGAGKSTLVRVINFLQKPTAGIVQIGETVVNDLTSKQLRELRRSIGMIFQHFNLMDNRTIFDNVDFSLKYSGKSKQQRKQKVSELLELVGIADKANNYPSQLSGGQKQRVAIARALANDPEVLLCDEATSALDPKTTRQILTLLKQLNKKLNLTIVLITHEMQVVKEICNKVAVMEQGRVIEQGDCVQLFSAPQATLTKEFIRTATHVDHALATILENPKFNQLAPNECLVELSYVGEQTKEPIISQLYSKFQVVTNILYGNVEIVQEQALGSLIVTLQGDANQRQRAVDYLREQHVKVAMLSDIDRKIIDDEEGGLAS